MKWQHLYAKFKKMLTMAPIMASLDQLKVFHVYDDASDRGIGWLMHETLVAYLSINISC